MREDRPGRPDGQACKRCAAGVRRRAGVAGSVGLALLLSWAAAVNAQQGARWQVGAGLEAGLVVGSSSDYLDAGLGPELGALYSLDRRGAVSLRAAISYLHFGDTQERLDQFQYNRVNNALLMASLGAQAEAPLGWLRPYAVLVGGWSTNFWERQDLALGLTERGSSGALLASLGAGLRIQIWDRPVTVDLGGRVVGTGTFDIATESQLVHDRVGLLLLRLGVSVGIR